MSFSKLRFVVPAVTCAVALSSTSVALACDHGTSTTQSTNRSAQAGDWHWRHHHHHKHFFRDRNEGQFEHSGTSGTSGSHPCDGDHQSS
jgi:hypothetical protein